MKRGELYMAELDPVIGSEQGGRRPVLIIQNDMGNLHSPTVIVAPLTASTGKPEMPTHVHIPKDEGGLWRGSTVLCEQVRTLEKTRLSRRLGELTPQSMRRVEHALSVSLDMAHKAGAD